MADSIVPCGIEIVDSHHHFWDISRMHYPWPQDITRISAIPIIHCKISGMVTESEHANWTVDDLKPYVAHVVECFGVERLMFGSDWPVCLFAASYHTVLDTALEAVGPMSKNQRSAFLAGNAARFY